MLASALVYAGEDGGAILHQIHQTQPVVPVVSDLDGNAVLNFFGGSGCGERRQQVEREVLLHGVSSRRPLALGDAKQPSLCEPLLAVLAESDSGVLKRRVPRRHVREDAVRPGLPRGWVGPVGFHVGRDRRRNHRTRVPDARVGASLARAPCSGPASYYSDTR